MARKWSAFLLAGGIGLLAAVDSASAAAVTFSPDPAGNIAPGSTGEEVSNTGVVFAWNAGAPGSPDVTVNGVLFQGSPTSGAGGISITHDIQPAVDGDYVAGRTNDEQLFGADLKTMLDTAVMSDGGGDFTMTFNGLALGTPYRAQFLTSDGSAGGGRTMTVASGGATSSPYSFAGNPDDGSDGFARYLFADFTADASTQTFTFTGIDGSRAMVGGVSISVIPEPSALGLLGVAAVAAPHRRRRLLAD